MSDTELDIDALDFVPEDPIQPKGAPVTNGGTILDKVGAEEIPQAKPPSFFRSLVTNEPLGKKRERKTRAPKADAPMPRAGKLAKGLEEMYISLGLMMMAVDPVCAQAVINSAAECARSMEKLARENAAVRRVLVKMLETSAWGAVIAAHLPIMMAIAMHHVPALKQGVQLPPMSSSVGSTLPTDDVHGGAREGDLA